VNPIENPSEYRQEIDPQGRRVFLMLMVVLGLLFAAAMIIPLVRFYQLTTQRIGDGKSVVSYGFDLSNFAGHRAALAPSGMARDGKMAMVDPPHVTAERVNEFNSRVGSYIKFLIPKDPVIGVAMGGEARAYPLRFVRVHEIVNDTLGGVPIAVTYSPLSDSAAVFDRRRLGRTLEFGYSGLLYNSVLVMYDRASDDRAPSLWPQLSFGPISGPALEEGAPLTVLPMRLTTWQQWLEAHPQTTVIDLQTEVETRVDPNIMKKQYRADPLRHRGYYREARLWYPVFPEPPAEHPSGLRPFDPVVGWYVEGDWRWAQDGPGVVIPPDRPTVRSLWFAWFAFGHGAEAARREPSRSKAESATSPPPTQ